LQGQQAGVTRNTAILGVAEVIAAQVRHALIVGCGNIAGGFDADRPSGELPLTHAGALSRHPGFRLAACIEPDAARREAFMAHWQVPLGFATIAEALAVKLRPDLVSICTPTHRHAADLDAAISLRPGAIFCEKPVTPSVALTQHWVEACDQAGVALAVNYTRRWAPDVIRLKEQLARGDWGELRSISGLYNKGILNNGGHLVDLVTYLAGPVELLAAGPAVSDFWPDDPTVSALLRTESGVPVALNTAHAGDYAVFELQLVAAKGVLIMENAGMNWRLRRFTDSPHFKGYRTLGPADEIAGEYPQAMSRAISNLHDALTRCAPIASTGHTALETQRVCEQIRDGSRAGAQ
jgi:predicted dehydrogenase